MIETPYETIAHAVEEWCKENGYQTMLVSISLHYPGEATREVTEILEFDGNKCQFVWVEYISSGRIENRFTHHRPNSHAAKPNATMNARHLIVSTMA